MTCSPHPGVVKMMTDTQDERLRQNHRFPTSPIFCDSIYTGLQSFAAHARSPADACENDGSETSR